LMVSYGFARCRALTFFLLFGFWSLTFFYYLDFGCAKNLCANPRRRQCQRCSLRSTSGQSTRENNNDPHHPNSFLAAKKRLNFRNDYCVFTFPFTIHSSLISCCTRSRFSFAHVSHVGSSVIPLISDLSSKFSSRNCKMREIQLNECECLTPP
jgi:hypothetical protein